MVLLSSSLSLNRSSWAWSLQLVTLSLLSMLIGPASTSHWTISRIKLSLWALDRLFKANWCYYSWNRLKLYHSFYLFTVKNEKNKIFKTGLQIWSNFYGAPAALGGWLETCHSCLNVKALQRHLLYMVMRDRCRKCLLTKMMEAYQNVRRLNLRRLLDAAGLAPSHQVFNVQEVCPSAPFRVFILFFQHFFVVH